MADFDMATLPADVQRIITSEAQLREAQAMASVGSWEWDIQADKISWSEELYRHFGLNPDEFEATYEAFIERIHPDDRAMVNKTVEAAFASHKPWAFEHRIVRPTGEARWVFGQGAVVVENGQPIRMYGTEQDITEQKKSAEVAQRAYQQELIIDQLEETNQFRINLLNTVAHELNTPLTPLALQAHLLQRSCEHPSPQQEKSMAILDRNIRRLKLLVSDILDMSRMQANKLELRTGPVRLHDIIEDAMETFAEAAREAGIQVEREGGDIAVVADADRMTQVVYNLLGNAIKFTPKGGQVTMRAIQSGDDVVLEVIDTGLGITTKESAGLFQAFGQVHEAQTQPGTGLGLFISKGIVEAHGGTLTMHSEGRDKGSTFAIRLPVTR